MKEEKITWERFKRILEAFFPYGYGKSSNDNKYDEIWFLGWLHTNGFASILDLPMEINLDGGGSCVIFYWYGGENDRDISDKEVKAYICGVMSVIEPNMVVNGLVDLKTSLQFDMKEE